MTIGPGSTSLFVLASFADDDRTSGWGPPGTVVPLPNTILGVAAVTGLPISPM
jgi:hypothetical protein